MPASVTTPSTSTHNKRPLRARRARSDPVTGNSGSRLFPTTRLRLRNLPVQGSERQERVGWHLDRGHTTDEAWQGIGRNALSRGFRGQQRRRQSSASRDVLGGDKALAPPHAHGGLLIDDVVLR